MTGWNEPETDRRPQQRNLIADIMSFGPASTPGREFVVAVLQIGLVLLLVFVVFPDRFTGNSPVIVMVITAVYFLLRIAIGIPKWRQRRQ